MPASTAARVAANASSTRSMRSLSSTLVTPPTLITATRPVKRAMRSSRPSRSASIRARCSCASRCDTRASTDAWSPCAPTIVVSFSVTVTRSQVPRCSIDTSDNSMPVSLAMTWPPSATARSSSSAIRRCPKPGARTTTDCIVLCMLPPTSSCNAGPSTSSARTSSGRSARLATSIAGMISCTDVIFLLVNKTTGLSRTASMRSGLVTM
ncbi:Uncharacterised protein [Mycobacteroides abscessus subsp. abscessus]|nr:Uncharacterised protein [Mycobacteroides abscessus subsp. abscessus]